MNTKETLLAEVLKGFIKQNRVLISDSDKEALFALAERHSLSAMCEYAVFGVTKNVNRLIVSSTQRIFAAEQLLEKLEQNKIKTCVMKGFIIRKYYPVPELRTFGDIDFLIERNSADSLCALMEQLGYERVTGEEHVLTFKKGYEYYEFHTSLLESDVFSNDVSSVAERAWEYAKPYEKYSCIYEFTREYHLFYVILHIAKHFRVTGAGIRMIMDVSVMTDGASDIDWDKVFDMLKQCDMTLFACNILFLCSKWFGCNLPDVVNAEIDEPSGELYDSLCEFIFEGGTFGFYGRSFEAAEIRREMGSNPENAQRKTIFRFFFPSYEKMCRKYKFLQGKKYLLPIAYIMRFFGGIFKPERKKRATKRLKGLETGKNEAMRQHEMYRACGLNFFKG